MKFLRLCACLATFISHSTECSAFTLPKLSNIRLSARVANGLRSTLVQESDTSVPEPFNRPPEGKHDQFSSQSNLTVEDSTRRKSYLDDGFIFGLTGSGIERPKGKVASVVVEGDSLETTPQQVGIVSATFVGHALFAANAVHTFHSQTHENMEISVAASIATIVASWIAADFGSGVFHWSVDNYGNGRTPVMGNIIAAFQGHHSAPWTITYRGFCNNVWKLCIPFGVPTVAAISFLAGPGNPMGKLSFDQICMCTRTSVLFIENDSSHFIMIVNFQCLFLLQLFVP